MNELAALLVAAVGTYTLRVVSVRAFATRTIDARSAAVLRHAALAIMASLVITSLPTSDGVQQIDVAVVAGLGAGVIASRRIGNVSLVIVVAVVSYALTRAISTS